MRASKSVEDYVKRLYTEQRATGGDVVPMGRLAQSVGVAPGTATAMVKTLAEASLVRYEPYVGVRLTRRGERLALDILRRHRLVELLLVDVLGMDWSEVHKEAEELEHAVSDRLLDHLDRFLDYPSVDPHGDPIPDPSGRARERRKAGRPLREAPAGAKVEVVRVTDQSPAFLKTVTRLGLQPGARIQVVESDESLDTTTVRVGRRAVTLGARAVRNLIVRG